MLKDFIFSSRYRLMVRLIIKLLREMQTFDIIKAYFAEKFFML
jgi:hypothetical protein